jgi:aryl-alcohol dehydrogenase-like predicted oxidoreductase
MEHRLLGRPGVQVCLGALTDLVQQGKVRYIGSSSFSAGRSSDLPRAPDVGGRTGWGAVSE